MVEKRSGPRKPARKYEPPMLANYGFVASLTGMPGGSVGCEGASGRAQPFNTGGDVGGDCSGAPNSSPGG